MSQERPDRPHDLQDMEPGEEAMRSLRSAAERGSRWTQGGQEPRRRGWNLPGLIGVLLAIAVFAGLATAVVITYKRPEGDPLPRNEGAAAALRESPYLAQAPWLFQRNGSGLIQNEPENPSIIYPPGTTYAQAVQRLVSSVIATGELPEIARPGPLLDRGVVWEKNPGGPRLSLVSPTSYADNGKILVPSFVIDGSVPTAAAARIADAIQSGEPAGSFAPGVFRVSVPILRRCHISPRPAPCPLPDPSGG